MGSARLASEQRSLEAAREHLRAAPAQVRTFMARLERIVSLPVGATIVDIGSGQGCFLIAAAQTGLHGVGVEPWDEARDVGARLAEESGVDIRLIEGVAEDLPVDSESCEIVRAQSVIEHVLDAQAAFNEVYRILKPGGVFWFNAASSLCPRQVEIDGFPAFGWYPDRLKRRIMQWAKTHKPHLVGYTHTPAVQWFTPWKARRMLRRAGFARVYDRWDLRLPSEGGGVYRVLLRTIKLCGATKFVADVLVAGCSFAAVK